MTITNGVTTQTCACGCGQSQKNGGFRVGHEEYVRSAVMSVLGSDATQLAKMFGFGPGARNAKELAMAQRKAQKAAAKVSKPAVKKVPVPNDPEQ